MVTDLLVIGGGINGTAIAADAASRGLSVVLCDQDDLAAHTSSRSSKLIHGGLRYLEQFEFKLVRESLYEREILLKRAPHLVNCLAFVLPHHADLRPAWILRSGLWLYDFFCHDKSWPRSQVIDLANTSFGEPLQAEFKRGFIYSDAQTDDARLVIHQARFAADYGAQIFTRTKILNCKRTAQGWEVVIAKENQLPMTLFAKCLINATGPWADRTHAQLLQIPFIPYLRLVKGSHIVVSRLYKGQHAYILQHSDRRIIFVLPYQTHFSLIGTTEIEDCVDLMHLTVTSAEIDYLCAIVSHYFKKPCTAKEVIWQFAGARPLVNKVMPGQVAGVISRDYKILQDIGQQQAPLLTILGGKLTTHRALAQAVVNQLQFWWPKLKPCITKEQPLPGGDLPTPNVDAWILSLAQQYAWLPQQLLQRYTLTYGTRIHILLQDCTCMADLGQEISHALYEREMAYLKQYEWAETMTDVLWRRTKLGLYNSTTSY